MLGEESEFTDVLEKIEAQQESILIALAEIKDQIEANDWRRSGIWILESISNASQSLKMRFPDWGEYLDQLSGRLDANANVAFRSAEDLRAQCRALTIIAGMMEDGEKTEDLSMEDLSRRIRSILDDLETLDNGYPPGATARDQRMHYIQPELGDVERVAARKRIDEKLSKHIGEQEQRRRAEEEEFY